MKNLGMSHNQINVNSDDNDNGLCYEHIISILFSRVFGYALSLHRIIDHSRGIKVKSVHLN